MSGPTSPATGWAARGAYQATIWMVRDPTWSIFTDGIPPPIFGGGAAPKDEQAASAEPDPAQSRLLYPEPTKTADGSLLDGLG